jgi:hypothetical protein
MTPQKSSPGPEPAGRKPWVKKTPIEIFLEQITKQEQRVVELREALAQEERELEKLQEARTVLERK